MEEFLAKLLEQVRCNGAKPYIEEELRGHIEDQIADGIACGMTIEAAQQAAIKDMGDPVEIGISLDRIHRPQRAWGILLFMFFISVAGVVAHSLIGENMGEEQSFALYTAIGFAFMILIYRMDYTIIAKFSKIIALLLWVLIFMGIIGIIGARVNGRIASITLGRIHLSIFSLMMLYIPLYGAIVYKYHGCGYRGLIKSLIWMIIPCFIALRLASLENAVLISVSMVTVLSIGIWNKWFAIAKKKVLAVLWGCVAGLPILIVLVGVFSGGIHAYRLKRLEAFLAINGDANYLPAKLRSLFLNNNMWGNSHSDILRILPNLNDDYILSFLAASYGILIGIAVCCMLVALTIKVFSVAVKQKNQLGMIMGCGCGIVFFVNIVINIMENTGLLPSMQSFLPFFSAGGSDIIACYMMMGIVLSIYRYKNILPKHIDARNIELEIR